MTAPPQRRLRLGPLRRPAGMFSASPGQRTSAAPGKLRRRVGTAARLLGALFLVGGLYTAFVPHTPAAADDQPALSATAAQGKELYQTACITCHGNNAQGVPGRGPSLIGVGSA